MTQWGFGLLLAYVVLGVSGMTWHKARVWVVLATVAVLTGVFASYGALR